MRRSAARQCAGAGLCSSATCLLQLSDGPAPAGRPARDGSGLINMNGPMYNPLTCQMLAPDRFVQDPGAPGGYNRYRYAHNNPLKYTDPSGWLSAQEWAAVESIIKRTFETGELFGGFVTAGGGSGEYHTREEALDAGFAYMRKLISNGEQRLTAETWNGYMQEKWKNYAYNVNTTNSTSAKYGAGFKTTGLTFANANLGAAVTVFYSYSKAEALFLSNGNNNDGFWKKNWNEIAFLSNDLTQALANNSSLKIASRYNLPTTSVQLPFGLTTRVSTKVVNFVSTVGKPIAKATPWVSGALIVSNVVSNKQVTAGDVYQGIVTGLSVIPAAGLLVGGSALLLEGVSYLFTGKSVSDNINEKAGGGVIADWR